MPEPFKVPATGSDIPWLDLRVRVAGSVSDPSYSYNVNYDTHDNEGRQASNHDGSVVDELTTGEKTQLNLIIDRLIAEGRSNLS